MLHLCETSRWHFLVLLIFFTSAVIIALPAAGQPVVDFGPDDTAVALHGHMALFRDPGGQMTLEQVIAPAMRERFEPLPISLSLGYVPTAAWLRFTLRNTGPAARRLYLDFEPPFIDHVDVFVPDAADTAGASDFHEIRLGDHVRVAYKPVFNLNNVVPVELPPRLSETV